MKDAENPVEMEIPIPEGSARSGDGALHSVFATAPARGANGERVMGTSLENGAGPARIPSALNRSRPSPAMDPLARARLSRLAKWIMLLALIALVGYLPAHFYDTSMARAAESSDVDKAPFFLAAVTAAAMIAGVIATGLPRLLLPGFFGRWREPVEAFRDWVIVGVLTGVLYYLAVFGAREFAFGPASGVRTTAEWIDFRLPLLIVAGIIGVFAARALAVRAESLIGRGFASGLVQVLVQVALLAALEHPIEGLVRSYATVPGIGAVLGGCGALLVAISLGIVTWATTADAGLSSVRRNRSAAGVDDGTAPVNLTLTVIGGRESGKTVLLAGAFYEWSTQSFGDLRITPTEEKGGVSSGVVSLEAVARELYVDNHFPIGTVSTQNLPFDISLGRDPIARFSFLDYPGGAIAGRVADDRVIQEFWERVEDTDGVMLIADMSYVRRSTKDSDWLEVRNAYRTVMQRLVDRNGRRRVVPVALVLTKCDEFIDPTTGRIDNTALQAGLHEFRYHELEEEWRELNGKNGPGFVEFSTWITSAITYSQPQSGADGRPDLSKPFQIAPPPPSIAPTGCASPLLWITSKVMRWNVTLFYDISTFLFGSTPRVRRRVDSILELERIADEHAGRV